MERLDENRDLFFGMNKNTYLMLMHLSQFMGFVIAGFGFIVPVVLWLIRKDADTDVDRHGKNIVNFIISWLIYYMVAALLTFTVIGAVIGIPLLVALGVCEIIFIIVASIKANQGEYWDYPFSLQLIK